MLGSTPLRSPTSSSGVLAGASLAKRGDRSEWKRSIVVRSERSYGPLPKVKRSFGPTLLERAMDSWSLVQRIKFKLSDYCTTLDVEECLSCWKAYSEIEDLKKKWPPEELDSFLQDASNNGMKSLIFETHHAAAMLKEEPGKVIHQEITKESGKRDADIPRHVPESGKRDADIPRHVPDGIPTKTYKELQEEENQARMLDSDYTRLLRSLRIYPSWYKERPEVEDD